MVVKIRIEEESDLVEHFNKERLSEDLAHYILNEIKYCLEEEVITLQFDLQFKADKKKEQKIIDLIEGYFKNQLFDLRFEKTKGYNKAMIFFIIGILFFLASYFLRDLLMDVISLLGWVILWEGIYILIFERRELNVEQKKVQMILDSTKEFIE